MHENWSGVSLKTQELFLIVFCTRYLDLFTRFISMYNSVMKVLYIGTTGAIIHLIRYKASALSAPSTERRLYTRPVDTPDSRERWSCVTDHRSPTSPHMIRARTRSGMWSLPSSLRPCWGFSPVSGGASASSRYAQSAPHVSRAIQPPASVLLSRIDRVVPLVLNVSCCFGWCSMAYSACGPSRSFSRLWRSCRS